MEKFTTCSECSANTLCTHTIAGYLCEDCFEIYTEGDWEDEDIDSYRDYPSPFNF